MPLLTHKSTRTSAAIQPTPRGLRLRDHDFETAYCEYCRYFKGEFCKVLDVEVDEEQVCDAYQGAEGKYKPYKVAPKNVMAFAKGMKRLQPYKHIVVGGIDTPVGPLLLIKDTMRPKPHHFSLDMDFSVEHTSREHFWTQGEADKIIKAGRR